MQNTRAYSKSSLNQLPSLASSLAWRNCLQADPKRNNMEIGGLLNIGSHMDVLSRHATHAVYGSGYHGGYAVPQMSSMHNPNAYHMGPLHTNFEATNHANILSNSQISPQSDDSPTSLHSRSVSIKQDNTPKQYFCSLESCRKAFARKSDLSRHERIHSNIRPHECDWQNCGKAFIQRSALAVHRRVHTREKPHACSVCDKRFSDSSSLARHRRTHTGIKAFKCPYASCQRTFTRKTTLTRHQNNHNGQDQLSIESDAKRSLERNGSDESYTESRSSRQSAGPSPADQISPIELNGFANLSTNGVDMHYLQPQAIHMQAERRPMVQRYDQIVMAQQKGYANGHTERHQSSGNSGYQYANHKSQNPVFSPQLATQSMSWSNNTSATLPSPTDLSVYGASYPEPSTNHYYHRPQSTEPATNHWDQVRQQQQQKQQQQQYCHNNQQYRHLPTTQTHYSHTGSMTMAPYWSPVQSMNNTQAPNTYYHPNLSNMTNGYHGSNRDESMFSL